MKIGISGASGKTGFRVAEEALKEGFQVRLLVRKNSKLPDTLKGCEKEVISICDDTSIDKGLEGCDALVIATGARPSIDLTGPAKVDAIGVQKQVKSAQKRGVKRIILVSSLCSGKLMHPLNLFGLILIWKRVGETSLEKSGLDWTIIRPGGLNEQEEDLEKQGINYSGPKQQEEGSIPRRLVANCCVEALKTSDSIGRILEVTSSTQTERISMKNAIKDIKMIETSKT